MKHLFVSLLFIGIFGFRGIFAQNRIATVDRSFVILEMPEYKKMESLLTGFSQKMESKVGDIQNMIAAKENEIKISIENNRPDVSAKENELQILKQTFQNTVAEMETTLKNRHQELIQPILAKFNEAVRVVAVSKGYTHVADNPSDGTGQFVFAPAEEDITSAVLRQLNIIKPYPAQ